MEGVEVGRCSAASTAASSARFVRIACRWEESVGAAEFEVSRSFPDAIDNLLGRCADRPAFVVIEAMTAVYVPRSVRVSSMWNVEGNKVKTKT